MNNNIIGQVLGGDKKIVDGVNTVADVQAKMGISGYTAAINGCPASDSDSVSEGDIVTFSKAVKGGC